MVESGEFAVGKPPEEVVKVLSDPAAVARLIPGVGEVREAGGEYVGEAAVRLGHLSGKMKARFRYAEVRRDGVVVVGRAEGMQTTADFKIAVDVQPGGGGGSLVRWRFEGSARGLAASLAPSLVRDALRRIAAETAKNLAAVLS
ncbi:carbon monoxide dehydrogenase subunit G [Pyrobaculum neutrophilum V24Sta]|uniref:Carbon monoxide dehydrogenase subunit G n=1 Tax=Pyrobaculum neutrophilum (strain DSM 2338 / JCM 9278 / NBRC 100436 / V24Sta) TaxID=444157 RepID=B1YBE3_PYRNV|nr:carbon monoxide dehydrogenase subunit G [Pyrobaculum neutrophilum V24Sta]